MMRLDDFKAARNVLKGILNDTGLIYSQFFSKATGNYVYLKPENMQVTGAYKIRGAYYTISTLSDQEKAAGLITASAGNHAQGVAYAAKQANVPATIVMPTTTPLIKVNNTKNYGANVVLHGATFDDAAEEAARRSKEDGLTYIHTFNDLRVATGCPPWTPSPTAWPSKPPATRCSPIFRRTWMTSSPSRITSWSPLSWT